MFYFDCLVVVFCIIPFLAVLSKNIQYVCGVVWSQCVQFSVVKGHPTCWCCCRPSPSVSSCVLLKDIQHVGVLSYV